LPKEPEVRKGPQVLKTKSLAMSGVFAGLAIALMWVLSFVPSMDYALPAAAGMLTLVLVIELGPLWALGKFLVAGIISVLLLPNKGVALVYVIFFGYYPALKYALEQKLPAWLAWILKYILFNIAVISAYYLATKVFGFDLSDFGPTFGKYAKAVMLGMGNVGFFLYDYIILGSFTLLYKKRWKKKLRRLMGR